MMHLDLNLTTETEQQLRYLVKQNFQGSFEAFIAASVMQAAALFSSPQPTTSPKLSARLLAPEIAIDDDLFERSQELSRDSIL